MNLRLRLIVVFFLLSVVPVGALTYYTYTNNLKAVRDAAEYEAETLASELSQRMELVTAQLSLRVGRLMNIPDVAGLAPSAAANSTPAADTSGGATGTTTIDADQARDALGDLAVLLNSVELFDPRRRGGGPGGRGGRGPAPPERGRGAPPPAAPSGSADDAPRLGPGAEPDREGAPREPRPPDEGPRFSPGSSRDAGPFVGPPPGGPGGPDRPGGPPPRNGQDNGPRGRGGPPPDVVPTGDPDRILIDMEPIRRQIIQQIVPEGEWERLTPDERQRVFSEVNQRMMGIRQGIQIVQQTVSERAAAAAAAAEAVSPPPVQTSPLAPDPTPSAPPVAATPPTSAGSEAQATLQRRAELSGGRLGVSLERDGEVVSQVNAEINLPNLLAMVFTTTRRASGEVPFAVAADGRIYAPSEADRQMVESIGSTAVRPDETAEASLSRDWIIATTPDPTASVVKFGIARPLSESLDELRRTTARNAGLGLAFIALALIGIVPLASGMTRNLSSLSDGVRRIALGDYGARVTVRSRDEVGRLAEAFNQMAADVEKHQRSAVEQERIRRELELGRQIQHDMLPQAPLRLGLTEVKGVSIPAREVGGDFFNYFRLHDGTVALLVGDVSGKGVGAALLMANIQAALRTRLSLGQDLASLAQELDLDIERSTPGPVYATLFVGIFDPVSRLLRCVNAGHNPQYVLRSNGRIERLESTGRPIGLFSGGGYVEQQVDLEAGDLLFFYTDGCVEAENAGGDMFGADRLEAVLAASAGRDAGDVLATVETEVSRFRADVDLQDDATMMVVKVG